MNFGQVSRGEYVVVSTESGQSRGRQMGVVNITSDYNEAGIQVSCSYSSSYISFNTNDVYFDSCNIKESGSSSSPSSTLLLDQSSNSNETHTIHIGGSIQIPSSSSTQNSNHSGVVRIEVNLL